MMPGQDLEGDCASESDVEWDQAPAGRAHLHVQAAGPEGSGNFWKVTVGVSGADEALPLRGLCLSTSTVGWRTLHQYPAAFTWLKVVDGEARFVLWDSFPLFGEAMASEMARVGWAYRLQSDDSFVLDLEASRRLVGKLSDEYSAVLVPEKRRANQSGLAAAILKRFADQQCRLRETP